MAQNAKLGGGNSKLSPLFEEDGPIWLIFFQEGWNHPLEKNGRSWFDPTNFIKRIEFHSFLAVDEAPDWASNPDPPNDFFVLPFSLDMATWIAVGRAT